MSFFYTWVRLLTTRGWLSRLTPSVLAATLLTGGVGAATAARAATPTAPATSQQPRLVAGALPTPAVPPGPPRTTRTVDPSTTGLTAVLADVRRRAYFLDAVADRPAGTRLADNPAQQLVAELAATRYTVSAPPDSITRRPAWAVAFALRGIGRAHAPGLPLPGPDAAPIAHDSAATYGQGQAVAVDYTNTPAGLRQTYRLARRPAGTGLVRVRLAVRTALRVAATPDGTALAFSPPGGGGPVLRYDDLRAWDATGRALPARMQLRADSVLTLAVDDAGARYPLTIDPLASTPADTRLGATTDDIFARYVAGAGDVNGDGFSDIIVGAYGKASNTGKAYVYYGSATGLSAAAPDVRVGEAANDRFGSDVAGAGDVNGDGFADVIIGAVNHANFTGKTYVYYGSATGLSATAGDTRLGDALNDLYGSDVAGAGDIDGDGFADVIVSASGIPQNSAGKVYVYYGSATGLRARVDMYTGEAVSDQFGQSVAGAGDVNGDGFADVIVGAPSHVASNRAGKLYLYYGSATGLSATAGDTRVGEAAVIFLGASVSAAGDVNGDGFADVIAGAYGGGTNGTLPGAAYVYYGSATGLSAAAPAKLVGEIRWGQFGHSAAGVGDIDGDGFADVVVGDPRHNGDTGKVYVYYGSATGLSTTAGDVRLGEASGDWYGIEVAGAGDVNGDGYADVLVGTPRAGASLGKAYVYYGSPGTLAAAAPATRLGEAASNYFGWNAAGAGDVNGDGFADVIIGAYGNAGSTGKVYVYYGSPTGLRTSAPDTRTGEAADDRFGYGVAGAGDVNGDGYADVIVGAYGNAGNTGKVYVYYGSPTGLRAAAPDTRLGEAGFDYFGAGVAGAGDVNGDGYADVIVSANGHAGGTGKVYVYYGSATGLSTAVPADTRLGEAANDYFGVSVAGAGDVNGDGYADVIIGANGNAGSTGKAYVYYGSPTGLRTAAPDTRTGEAASDQFGYSVAGAGDVNGDGFADVLVGSYINAGFTGKLYVYYGSATGLGSTPADTRTGEAGFNYFGYSVAGAGDVNSDGFADVLVGATGHASATGKLYVYYGGATGLSAAAATRVGEATGNRFGASVVGAGDVNGDGFADVLAGAYGYAGNTGKTYLYLGNDTPGRPAALRLLNTDLSTPLTVANRPVPRFGLGLQASSTVGRTHARLAWETVAPGQPFSGTPTGHGPWTDLPGSTTELTALVDKVGMATRVRARLEYASAARPAASTVAGTGGVGGKARYGPWRSVSAAFVAGSNLATPLPVVLTHFTAAVAGPTAVRLAWATASEQHSARFEVERSADGRAWRRVGTVPAAGRSATPRPYGFVDAAAPAGRLYYRLRQVDTDGTFAYSAVRSVVLGRPAGAGLTLFPNPARDAVQVRGAAPGTALYVRDALGRLRATAPAAADGTTRVSLAGLPPGVYVVQSGGRAQRLVVE